MGVKSYPRRKEEMDRNPFSKVSAGLAWGSGPVSTENLKFSVPRVAAAVELHLLGAFWFLKDTRGALKDTLSDTQHSPRNTQKRATGGAKDRK